MMGDRVLWRRGLLAGALIGDGSIFAMAQTLSAADASPVAETAAEGPSQEFDRLVAETDRLRDAGKFDAAAVLGGQALVILRNRVPEESELLPERMGWLADIQMSGENWPEAERLLAEVLEWSKEHRGAEHWQTIDASLALSDAQQMQSLSAADRAELLLAAQFNDEIAQLHEHGRIADATRKGVEALKIHQRILGDQHPDTATILDHLAGLYASTGDYAKAEPLFQKSLKIFRKVLGDQHPATATSLHNLAELYQATGEYNKAESLFRQSLEVCQKVLGDQHPDTADSLNGLAALYLDTGDFAKAEPLLQQSLEIRRRVLGDQDPDTAMSLNNLALLYHEMGDYTKAEPLYRQGLKIAQETLGDQHPATATSLNNLAGFYYESGDFAKAEPLFRQSLEIRRKVFGDQHPDTADSLHNLASFYRDTGDYAKSEPLYRQSLEICKTVLGDQHPDTASTLGNLALLYHLMGDYAKAEPLYRQSLEIRQKVLGDEHPDTSASLNHLAVLYEWMGDYAKAEPLCRRGLEIRQKVLGDQHPDTADSLNNLASLYAATGDYAKAEPLFQQSLEICQKVLGDQHPSTATSLNNLAILYVSMGDYAKAEPLYRQSLEINQNVLGDQHRNTAASLNNLAGLYQDSGDYAKAEPLYHKSLEITQKALGDHHPDTAGTLHNLAGLYASMGNFAKSESLYRQSLDITRRSVEATAAIQSERQQLAMGQSLRHQLDGYLSLILNSQRDPLDLYGEVLRWKGATLVRQRGMRMAHEEPGVAASLDALEQTTRQLATLSRSIPAQAEQLPAWRQRLAELSRAQEKLEAELSVKSEAFRRATKDMTLDELLLAIPADAVLVDFLEFNRSLPPSAPDKPTTFQWELVAFIVQRAENPADRVRLLGLGPVEPIGRAIDEWRASYGQSPEGKAAGQLLRATVWEPLVPSIGEAKTILVATDGVLGRLPLVALPGKAPDTYLLEDYRLACIPVPQLLPALVQPASANESSRSPATGTAPLKELLLLGDVNYDAGNSADATPKKKTPRRPGESRRAPAADATFRHLEYTKAEIDAMRDLYGQLFEVSEGDPRLLTGDSATEASLRNLAPQFRHLHLATHGFFSPPEYVSAARSSGERSGGGFGTGRFDGKEPAVVGFNPGLLSGLALAGANLEPPAEGDDGVLTAQEIAFLQLQGVDLVVLSACETGLGDVAGGEGLLGVQRAFQISGAKTTVASLWSVDDLQTMALMKRFYHNLWKEEMTRLDALREAQLWMLEEGPRRDARIRPPGEKPAEEPKRSPPVYWAPFVLSGDWR